MQQSVPEHVLDRLLDLRVFCLLLLFCILTGNDRPISLDKANPPGRILGRTYHILTVPIHPNLALLATTTSLFEDSI